MNVVDCTKADFRLALKRGARGRDPALEHVVAEIIEDVRTRGDEALLEYARRFDAPGLTTIETDEQEILGAVVQEEQTAALQTAYRRIRAFHDRQMEVITAGWTPNLTWQLDPETKIGQRISSLKSVGLYVPGGEATYPSSVLMLAGPVAAAGVPNIFCASPAQKDGSFHPAVLTAMRLAGIRRAFKIGGAAAIAAFAFGTETVPPVDKIAGPGNRYVSEAKRQLWGSVGLDGFAGPSEVCVLADDSANVRFAAADLLTQIEHAPDNAAFLVCTDSKKLEKILAEVQTQLTEAPRAQILKTALQDQSLAFLARDIDEAIEIVNAIAPEHLSVSVREPDAVVPRIRTAGCILVGEWTPESAADYCLGPSHTLPTSGAARFSGPVSVLDFLKITSFADLTKEQLAPLSKAIESFGHMEGLPTHTRGVTIRFE